MFTDVKSLIAEGNCQVTSQRTKALSRLKDFDDNFENTRGILRKRKSLSNIP